MRAGARDAGLFVKTENVDAQELLPEWMRRLKTQGPSCIQFLINSIGERRSPPCLPKAPGARCP